MSSTDTQDPMMGLDQIYDDMWGLNQKLSPKHFPYDYEVIGEREFLLPFANGTEYLTSDTLELKNLKMERRPMYVIQMTQLDSNYVYGKRIMYIDRELLTVVLTENYDQKGRLYRSNWYVDRFYKNMGALCRSLNYSRDHLDLHSTVGDYFFVPAFFPREGVSMRSISKFLK